MSAAIKSYCAAVLGYMLAVALIAVPASLPLYACQVFLLPAFGVMWVGLDVVLAACVALVGLITLARVSLSTRIEE